MNWIGLKTKKNMPEIVITPLFIILILLLVCCCRSFNTNKTTQMESRIAKLEERLAFLPKNKFV